MIVYFFANTQHENLGDRGIAISLLAEVRSFAETIVNAKGCPEDYVDELAGYSDNVVRESKLSSVLSMVLKRLSGKKVFLLMKPGHFFGNDGGVLSKFLQFFVFLMLYAFGVRVVRLGCSLGPFGSTALFIEKISSRLFYKYTAREDYSISYMKRSGAYRTTYFPDLAFALPSTFIPPLGVGFEKRDTISLSFRSEDNILDTVWRVIEILHCGLGSGKKIRFVPVAQVTRDFSFLSKIASGAVCDIDKVVVYPQSSKEQIFDIYRKSEFIISNRLHALLFAAKLGCLPIALIKKERNVKIVGVFEKVGLADLIVDIDDPSLESKVTHLFMNRDFYLKRVMLAFEEQSVLISDILHETFLGDCHG
ncbi:MAG: polysaccharide pyruvyl transferase family protein [Vogesella sp.]|uniref:polysaccharide pyruvyl transferase family protein n=1 Tax=Vogesella sp. TaxID=1904252 RepID=UPI00391C30EC